MSFWQRVLGALQKEKVRPRSQRIRFVEEEKIFFALQLPTARFPVENLSETGLGLCVNQEIPEFPVYLDGKLCLNELEIPLFVEIVREAENYMGCRILKGKKEVRRLLHTYFQTEFLASQMKEAANSPGQGEGVGRPRWFYAPRDYELYLLELEKNIVQLQLSFGEHFVSGKVGERLRYGKVEGAELAQNPLDKKSALVAWQDGVPDEVRKTALRMVENIAPLSPRDRAQLKAILRN